MDMAAGMLPGVSLRRRLLMEAGNVQDRGGLVDTAKINLACQPWPDRCPARLAGSDATTRSGKGKGSYRLRA
jgi:hypothetical protein